MLRIILLVLSAFLITGCQDTNQKSTTELITDSYFFQKNTFNLNLYKCVIAQTNFNSTYRISSDQTDYLNLSTIMDQDTEIENCIHTFAKINELTPVKEELLKGNLYLELSNCIAKTEEDVLYASLTSYLEYVKNNDVNLWTGISEFEDNQFIWVNIWPSQDYRETFMKTWLDSSKSGEFSLKLSETAICENPYTNLFL